MNTLTALSEKYSIFLVVNNEEACFDDCLKRLSFSGVFGVVLDKCADESKGIAYRYTDRIMKGAWELESERGNAGIALFRGDARFRPHLTVIGSQGPRLRNLLTHHINKNISDMDCRSGSHTEVRIKNLAGSGQFDPAANMGSKIFSCFRACYDSCKGCWKKGFGIFISIQAALYPLVSLLKAIPEEAENNRL